ncbi:MAG: hypothetical protein MI921_21170 [Cytophagales bacterium]|nr:hypothetical protein [Cytophagales bacterium]
MISIVKAVRVISSLAFLGVLLYVYAYLPDPVKLPVDLGGIRELLVNKGNLFYVMVGIFAIVSTTSFFVVRLINTLPGSEISFKKNLTNWSLSFLVVINIFLILSLIIIGIINNTERAGIGHYATLAYVGPVLLVIWLFLLIFVVAKRLMARL